MRDPVVILHECADLVPGTRAETRLRWDARRIAAGAMVYPVRVALGEASRIETLYSIDERAALAMACEELAR